MTAREPDPIAPVRPCPRCGRPDAVTPATDHERDRTGCDWWCDACHCTFTGTAGEFRFWASKRIALEAEAMTTRPDRSNP